MMKPGTPITSIVKGTSGAVTATQTSTKVNSGNYGTVKAFLNITAVSGTSPTLVVKFQDSADNSNWVDVASGAFSSQNATGINSLVLSNVGLTCAPYRPLAEPLLASPTTSTSLA